MSLPRRIVIIASSIFLLFIVVISLTTALEARAPARTLTQISLAHAQKLEQIGTDVVNEKAKINGSAFDRASIVPPPTVYLTPDPTSASTTSVRTTTSVDEENGMIGESPTLNLSATSVGDGHIAPDVTLMPEESPGPVPHPPPAPQLPIIALSYTGSSGPKHCRGNLIQKLAFTSPASDYKHGTCVDLPDMARCGVFFAGKEAGCEADLFNMAGCLNSTSTYVNTVVFMPEERAVGAYWRSMRVRCGVEAPEASLLDSNLLSGLLSKPTGR